MPRRLIQRPARPYSLCIGVAGVGGVTTVEEAITAADGEVTVAAGVDITGRIMEDITVVAGDIPLTGTGAMDMGIQGTAGDTRRMVMVTTGDPATGFRRRPPRRFLMAARRGSRAIRFGS